MEFRVGTETARFHNPLKGGLLDEQVIERRWDPLTNRTCVVGQGLEEKAKMFFGTTDADLIAELARSSRQGCFFCPERVESHTPRYEESLIAGGRKRSGRAILFPNLFPLSKIHAVITNPEEHFLELCQFTPEILVDFFRVGVAFTQDLVSYDRSVKFVSINCNHLPPAGASIVHPHFQVYGGDNAPGLPGEEIARAEAYLEATGANFWQDLVIRERAADVRYISATDGIHWLAPFCPIGTNEVMAIVTSSNTLLHLTDRDLLNLSRGVCAILRYYSRHSLCSFNLSLTSGLLDGSSSGSVVYLRIISRQNLYKNYRNDDYFIQKLLGEELVITPPERIAAELKQEFSILERQPGGR